MFEFPKKEKPMLKRIAFVSAFLMTGTAFAAEPSPPTPPRASVQIAILLDTSSSMNGLIEQAKTQLWTVVNEFVSAKKDGKPPSIQVALYEYGKQSLSAEEGYVRRILPLTDDLDRVSEELFALKTNGGDEFCGWVIRDAATKLDWSPSSDVYKAIFIAGNEPFTQGKVDFRESCKTAAERGVVVNTIFCGANAEGIQTGWKDGAILADGRFMSIDQNRKVVEIPTPQDAPIAKLGIDLNKTYLPYGKMGQAGLTRQSVQDTNAVNSSQTAIVTRSISKMNAFYCNDGWDLVDAIKTGKCKLDDLKDDELPENLRKLDKAARKAKVDEAVKRRAEIQARIADLNTKREKFLAAERAKLTKTNEDSLDKAIVKAIRDQATRHHITFE